jgi:DNA-3-methyladenine glycosylase II
MEKIVNNKDLYYLVKKDVILSNIHSKYGEPPNWEREPNFVSLSKIILEQQVSLASAKAHFQKLNNYIQDFTPENLVKLTQEEMRNCQISRQKAKYLKEISEAVLTGKLNFEELNQLDELDVREILTSLKGIGNWTTDIYLLFCLQKKDIFPIGDIAIRNSIKELYGVTTLEEIIEVAENWRPYRSLGSYFMWHYYLKKRNRTAEY